MRIAVLTIALCAIALASGGGALMPFSGLWEDHDTGFVRLSVTSVGGIGYTDPPAEAGNGMKYPKTAATSILFHGAVLMGNDSSYIVDRFFGLGSTADHDFGVVDSLAPGNMYGLEEFTCLMDDAPHPAAKGLLLGQYTVASPDSGYKDFVIFIYGVINPTAEAVNGMYVGIWCDFDIANANVNVAGTDTVRRVVWEKPSTTAEYPTAGIQILDPAGWANLSAVDHAIWVYPDSGPSEYMKLRFLNGTIRALTSDREYDWSIVASAGPFDIPAGGSQQVAFAMVGGTNMADFLMNCDSAAALYTHLTGVSERPGVPAPIACRVSPNPFRGTTSLVLGTGFTGNVDVRVYDAAGNLVKALWQGQRAPATVTWDGRDALGRPVQNGVYLLQVKGDTRSHTAKVTLAR